MEFQCKVNLSVPSRNGENAEEYMHNKREHPQSHYGSARLEATQFAFKS